MSESIDCVRCASFANVCMRDIGENGSEGKRGDNEDSARQLCQQGGSLEVGLVTESSCNKPPSDTLSIKRFPFS